MDTENTRYEPRAMGGSVKQSLAMAIPKAFGFEAATRRCHEANHDTIAGAVGIRYLDVLYILQVQLALEQ